MDRAPFAEFIKKLRKDLKLSQEKFARLIGVSYRTVCRWEHYSGCYNPHTLKFLLNLRRILDKLDASRLPKETLAWLQKPDPELRDFTPFDLLGSNFATDMLLERIEGWNFGAA